MQIAPYLPHRNNEIHVTDFGRFGGVPLLD
jgi:hypothetical protein